MFSVFGVSLGEVDLVRVTGQPSHVKGQSLEGYNREAPPLIYTHLTLTQACMRERERDKGGEIDSC